MEIVSTPQTEEIASKTGLDLTSSLQESFIKGVSRGKAIAKNSITDPVIKRSLSAIKTYLTKLENCYAYCPKKSRRHLSEDGGLSSTVVNVLIMYNNKPIASFDLAHRKLHPTQGDAYLGDTLFHDRNCEIGNFKFAHMQTTYKYRKANGGYHEEFSMPYSGNIEEESSMTKLGSLIAFALEEQKNRRAQPLLKRIFGFKPR